MGSDGGGSASNGEGRQLTSQELALINAQTGAFNQQQAQQAQLFGAAQGAANAARGQNSILLNQINNSSKMIGNTAYQAAAEGARRRSLEEAMLANQRSVPGAVQALGTQIQGPNQLASLANLAATRAGESYTSPGASTLNAIMQGGYNGAAGIGPFGTSVNQINALAGSTSIDPQIAAMMGMGVNPIARGASGQFLTNLASRAGQIGAAPDVVERTLTPQALVTLRDVQNGNVPAAVQRLFSGTDTAARGSLETQFNAARQRLMESGVTGGALTRALAGLEAQRASGVAGQIEARENEARAFAANLLNQATTAGLTQPAQRQALALQGIGQAGQLGQAAGQLNVNETLARLQGLQSAAGSSLNQAQTIGGLLQSGGELQQGLLNTSRLGATSLGDQAIAFQQLRNQNLGLAGQMASQVFQGNLAANEARRQSLLQGLDAARGLGGQLGAGADALRYTTAPALATQLANLRQLGAQSQALPIDILRGGQSGGNVDLTGALNAIGRAQEAPGGVSRGQGMLAGGLSGAGSGALIGTQIGGPGWGTAIGAVGGGLLGMFGGGGFF